MGFHSASQKTISRRRNLVKCYNLIGTLKIDKKGCFLGKISQKNHAKLKKMRKPKMSWRRFQRPVNGKRNDFATKILNYPLKIGPHYTW